MNFDELTMKLYLEVGHNRTTRKKGNPKSALKAESYKIAPTFCNHVAIIASGAKGVYLSEPLPHLALSPLPVESFDFNDTKRSSQPSLRLQPNTQNPNEFSRWCSGAPEIASGMRKDDP